MKKLLLIPLVILMVNVQIGWSQDFSELQNKAYFIDTHYENTFDLDFFDPVTGVEAEVASFPNTQAAQLAFSALNAQDGIYYFMALDTNSIYHFFAIDLNNPGIISNPVFPQSASDGYVNELQTDPYTGQLYALQRAYTGYPGNVSLISIDPATANKTIINNIAGLDAIQTSFSALNPQDGIYYFMGIDTSGNSYLYSMDLNTGNIIHKQLFTQSQGNGYLYELQINQNTNILYALQKLGTAPSFSLISLDPLTGNKTTVADLPNVVNVITSFTSINTQAGLYYFAGQDTSMNYHFYSVDLTNGEINSILFEDSQEDGFHYELHYPNLLQEQINVPVASICQNDIVQISVPPKYKEYLWSNGDTTNSIFVSDSLNYSVKLTTECGFQTISNVVSVHIFDCSSYQETLTFETDTCILEDRIIAMAFADNVSFSGNQVFLTWNFVTARRDTLFLDAVYPVNKNGVYPISISIHCDDLKSDENTYYDILEVKHFDALGVVDNSSEVNYTIYPNPVCDQLNIDLKDFCKKVDIEIISCNGQSMINRHFEYIQKVSLDMSHLTTGLYLLKVKKNNDTRFFKLLKQ